MNHKENLEKSYLALFQFLLFSKSKLVSLSEKLNLTIVQAMTLLQLDEPKSMNSFTKIYHCDPSNTTGIMDGLERKKLIIRFESPNDRRVKMIKITPKGEKLRRSIIDSQVNDKDYVIKRLNEEELTTFVNLLDKVIA